MQKHFADAVTANENLLIDIESLRNIPLCCRPRLCFVVNHNFFFNRRFVRNHHLKTTVVSSFKCFIFPFLIYLFRLLSIFEILNWFTVYSLLFFALCFMLLWFFHFVLELELSSVHVYRLQSIHYDRRGLL